jgi:hypothetical protein
MVATVARSIVYVLGLITVITTSCKTFDENGYRERIYRQELDSGHTSLVGAGLPPEQVEIIPDGCELYVVRQITPEDIDVVYGQFDRPLMTDTTITIMLSGGDVRDRLWIPRTEIKAIHVSPDDDAFEKVDVLPTILLVAVGVYFVVGIIGIITYSSN